MIKNFPTEPKNYLASFSSAFAFSSWSWVFTSFCKQKYKRCNDYSHQSHITELKRTTGVSRHTGVSQIYGVLLVCREKLECHEFSQHTLPLLNCISSLVDVGCENSFQFYNIIAIRGGHGVYLIHAA